nr:hypothetical protein [Luteibacter rhizovicinus]
MTKPLGLWQLCLVIAAFAFVPAVHAAQDTVYFAGIAFTGDASDTTHEFPHLSRLLDSATAKQVNAGIRHQIDSHPGPTHVSFDQLGSIKDASNATALALAVDRETTSVEHVGGLYKIRLEISAQVLFFDFKERQVLGGLPLVLDYVDVKASAPSDADIDAGFSGMMLDTTSPSGLSAQFAAALARAQVPNAATRHLRVTNVTLADKSKEYLRQYAPTVNETAFRTQVAQEFGKYLSSNQKLAILPYRSNRAIGSNMAARFVEGDAYDLKIPEADYEVSLDIAGFKKVEQGSNNVNTVYIYGAFVDVTVREPLSGKVYFQQRIKQGATKEVPVTQTSVDDWAASYESLLLLFNNLTQAISNPGSTWTKSALPEGAEAKTQLSSLAELIKSCR